MGNKEIKLIFMSLIFVFLILAFSYQVSAGNGNNKNINNSNNGKNNSQNKTADILEFKCAPFFNAAWSNSSGVLSNFDWNNYPDYLSVVNNSNNYYLQTFGDSGVHRFNRADVKNLENLDAWGGTVYVNLKDVVHYSYPSDLVFLGGYNADPRTMIWQRDLGIAAYLSGGKYYIYMKPYYHNCYAGASTSQMFLVSNANTGWPDRFIKIDWYFTSNHNFYGRVDNSAWKLVPGGTSYTNFSNVAIGWVSSYSGGNVKFKNLLLYDSNCLPSQS